MTIQFSGGMPSPSHAFAAVCSVLHNPCVRSAYSFIAERLALLAWATIRESAPQERRYVDSPKLKLFQLCCNCFSLYKHDTYQLQDGPSAFRSVKAYIALILSPLHDRVHGEFLHRQRACWCPLGLRGGSHGLSECSRQCRSTSSSRSPCLITTRYCLFVPRGDPVSSSSAAASF